jgi:hypothetical protein
MKKYGSNEFNITISDHEYKNIMLGWQKLVPRFKDGIWVDMKRYDIINISSKSGNGRVRIEEIHEYNDIKSGMYDKNFMSIVPSSIKFNDAYNYVVYCLRNGNWNKSFILVEIKVID